MGGTGGSASTSALAVISRSTTRALDHRGATGAAAAALAQATAPTPAQSANNATSAVSTGGASSPAASVLKSLTGSSSGGGLGPLLPSLLVASVLGAAVLALVRRRRTS
jgi:hypothetical protein